MLPHVKRLVDMPPWCLPLAATEGRQMCVKLAGAWQRAAHLLPAFFAGGGLGEPAPVSPIGGTGATRPAKKKPICTTTSVAQAARPPGLAPPRHPALGFAPQPPNLMLVRAEPLAHMPPWCLLLAAAAGTDRCTPRWGLHPKTPNLMLPFAERLMGMPP